MTGYAGFSEGKALAALHREELLKRLPVWFLDRIRTMTEPPSPKQKLKSLGSRVYAEFPIEEGGVYRALWELGVYAAEELGTQGGLEVIHSLIPVRQEIIEVCEILDLDPYQLPSGGRLILAESGTGCGAPVIGRLTPGKAKVVQMREGTRYLEKPRDRRESVETDPS